MKKIMLIHHFGGIGGAGVSLIDIVKSLKESYDVTVLCPVEPNNMINLLESMGVNVISIPYSSYILDFYSGGGRFFFSRKACKLYLNRKKAKPLFEELIDNFEGDVVAINSMTLSWLGPVIKKKQKKTICFHRETFLPNYFLGTKLIKHYLRRYFDRVVFISKYDCSSFENYPKEKKVVIYDRVDSKKFFESNLIYSKGEKKYILFLGGFSKLKGAKVLVKSLKYLKESKFDIKLIFVGNKEVKNSQNKLEKIKRLFIKNVERDVNKIIKQNKLENEIIFRNITSSPEEYFKEASIIVFPSTLPHQARPVYEAGFSKIPIIISNFKNTEEFIKNNVTGFTFKKNDPRDLAAVIEKVLMMPKDKLNKILENNLINSNNKHEYETLSSELIALIENIEGEKNK
ncbi:glycosyltransferase family 4 protein [Enterococcus gallinarum]|uniref:glycosyltransferase family 4 protein n=1 Tax=Enterococcus gallinarum TaxID=1353 RepID=UPI0012E308EC|nr:glycosyltransferase family 4 protein [Enterococcus gallinarum]MUO32348.1 glycosyltransferase [Enterococcus gallinarum]